MVREGGVLGEAERGEEHALAAVPRRGWERGGYGGRERGRQQVGRRVGGEQIGGEPAVVVSWEQLVGEAMRLRRL
jgi:hypothetical protein